MARPRVVLDDDAWAAVRVAYVDTAEPVTRILARFGIQRHQLYDRIALENWRMRSSGVVKSAADVAPPVARPPPLPRAEPAIGDLVVEGVSRSGGVRPARANARGAHGAALSHHRPATGKDGEQRGQQSQHDGAGTGTRGEGADVDDDGDGADDRHRRSEEGAGDVRGRQE